MKTPEKCHVLKGVSMGSEVSTLVKIRLQMAKGREKQAGFVLIWFVFFVLKAVIVRVTEPH